MFGFFEKLSPAKFVKMLMREAARSGLYKVFVYDEQNFTLRKGEERMFLGNFYAEYNHAKGVRKRRVLGNFLSLNS